MKFLNFLKYKFNLIFSAFRIHILTITFTCLLVSCGGNENVKEKDLEVTPSFKSEVETESTNVCNICKREFKGRGYYEVSEGVWRPCENPYQCFICSSSCGMKHTRSWNNLLEKSGASSGSKCANCGMGYYEEGYCGKCGAASAEKAEEVYKRKYKCPYCNGTGIRGDEFCSSCNGRGHNAP